jgi:hypothetical protein
VKVVESMSTTGGGKLELRRHEQPYPDGDTITFWRVTLISTEGNSYPLHESASEEWARHHLTMFAGELKAS